MSNSARWVICAICAVLGVIALVYAVIYLTVPIHSLPGFVPGKKDFGGGHYHKRALLAGVIGIVLLGFAAYVGINARRSPAQVASSPQPAAGPAPADAPPADAGDDGGAVRS